MSFTKLDAQVILEGFDISPYIISLKRNHNLCSIVQTFTIECDKSLKDFLTSHSIDLKPSNTIVIYEFGVKKLTGHVRGVKFSRKPGYEIVINGTDLYKYAKDYFIDEDFGKSNGETVSHWVGVLLGIVGLNYVFDSPEVGARSVGPGIEFTLRTVDDALTEVIGYGSGYIYTDADGLVHIHKGASPSGESFTGGQSGNILKGTHDVSDEMTRNVAKVWGFKGDVILRPTDSPYISVTESVSLGMPVDKTVVYASNYVQTTQEAQRLANEIIQSLGKFDSIKTLEIVGNPDLFIGKTAPINVDLETEVLNETSTITTINSGLDKEGYVMQVGFDEFCPKFAGWQLSSPVLNVYAGTTKNGVFKSFDKGATWSSYNTGILPTVKNVRKIAADPLDQTMAIINGQLYKRTPDTSWTRVILPAPVNTAGDSPALTFNEYVSVENTTGLFDSFTVLVSYANSRTLQDGELVGSLINRSWVYTTDDFGVTWESSQVYNDTDFNFYGTDLSSKMSVPYVLCNKGVEVWASQYGRVRFEKHPINRRMVEYYTENVFPYTMISTEIPPFDYGVTDIYMYNALTNVYGPTILQNEIRFPIFAVSKPQLGTSLKNSISYPAYPYLMGINGLFSDTGYEPMKGVQHYNIATSPSTYRSAWAVPPSPATFYDGVNGGFFYKELYVYKLDPEINQTVWGDGYSGSIGLSFVVGYKVEDGSTPVHYRTCFSGVTTDTVAIDYNPVLTFDCGTIYWEFY